jgi:hypothetical protein
LSCAPIWAMISAQIWKYPFFLNFILLLNVFICIFTYLFFNTRDWTHGLVHGRQVLCLLSLAPSVDLVLWRVSHLAWCSPALLPQVIGSDVDTWSIVGLVVLRNARLAWLVSWMEKIQIWELWSFSHIAWDAKMTISSKGGECSSCGHHSRNSPQGPIPESPESTPWLHSALRQALSSSLEHFFLNWFQLCVSCP